MEKIIKIKVLKEHSVTSYIQLGNLKIVINNTELNKIEYFQEKVMNKKEKAEKYLKKIKSLKKVVNNDGGTFEIGDVVITTNKKSRNRSIPKKIKSFEKREKSTFAILDGLYNKNGINIDNIEQYIEYLKKNNINKKDYEILNLISPYGPIPVDDISYLKNSRYKIRSVKRLSDNTIFTVGDKVSATNNIYTRGKIYENVISKNKSGFWSSEYYNTRIKNFKFVENRLCIIYDTSLDLGQPIEFVKKLEN